MDDNLIEMEKKLWESMARDRMKARLKFGAWLILIGMFLAGLMWFLPMVSDFVNNFYGVER